MIGTGQSLALAGVVWVLGVIAVCLVVDLLHSVSSLLKSVAEHRQAQATSILHHCGLLENDDE